MKDGEALRAARECFAKIERKAVEGKFEFSSGKLMLCGAELSARFPRT
jgi:hypothetical protein